VTDVATSTPPQPAQARRLGAWITAACLAGVAAVLMWRGYDFYRQALELRPVHPDYRKLSPAGLLGHGYGIIGTAMIFTNLLYLVRRRFTRSIPAWAGSVKAWLNLHVFTGLVGSLLIVFHSAFQLRTPIARLTSVSLFIVVVTGFVGLHLFDLVPRRGLQALRARLDTIEPLFPGVVTRVGEALATAPVTALPHDASFVRLIVTVPRWLLEASARRRTVRKAARADKLFRALQLARPDLARDLLENLEFVASGEVDAQAGGAVMRSWRSLHRFLALLMLVSVSVHIGVAWYFGFRWVFER